MARVLRADDVVDSVPAHERGLNPEQLEVVRHREGPCAVYATAAFPFDPAYFGIRRYPYSANMAVNPATKTNSTRLRFQLRNQGFGNGD